MQEKNNNEAKKDDVSMYAPREDDIDAVYGAETKIYKIKKHTDPEDDTTDPGDEVYDPYAEEADTEEDELGEEAFSEHEAYFDEA